MKEKYKQFIEIDEEHMKKTIELSKMKLSKREIKYEESKTNIWLSFFKMESMNFCLLSFLSTLLLCLLSVVMPISSYGICLVNVGILGTIILYDYLRSSIMGVEELLKSVKYNSSKIFVYKSNIYLMISIICTLFLNLTICALGNFSFMTTLLYSLIPLYFISGLALLMIDKISNKLTLVIMYACCYLLFGAFSLSNQYNFRFISNRIILLLLLASFGFYCFGIYVHFMRIANGERNDLWNSILKD